MKVAQTPDELVSRKRAGQFIHAVLRLFVLVFTAAAVLSPADVLVFTLILIAGWIASVPLAYNHVYRGGRERLVESDAYDPSEAAGRYAPLWFAGTALGAKVSLALAAEYALSAAAGPTGGALQGVVALLAAYLLVYRGGYDRLVG